MPKKKLTHKGKKNQKPLSLYGVSEMEVLKDLLQSPPQQKTKKAKKTKRK